MAEKKLQYEQERKSAISDMLYMSMKLKNPYDRVKCVEWIRKLVPMVSETLKTVTLRNEYAQFMKICLMNESQVLSRPFSSFPPKEKLVPLPECLANLTADDCLNVPRTGTLKPVICHKSDDDRAFMTIKRTKEGDLFCYMAVAPNAMAPQPNM